VRIMPTCIGCSSYGAMEANCGSCVRLKGLWRALRTLLLCRVALEEFLTACDCLRNSLLWARRSRLIYRVYAASSVMLRTISSRFGFVATTQFSSVVVISAHYAEYLR
jgi:hypothetical protein